MPAELSNEYGKITISDELIADIAGYAAGENYGIVAMNRKTGGKNLLEIFNAEDTSRGVKVTAVDGNTYNIDIYVTLMYGVSFPAVAANTRANVKYRVETLTGLKVQAVNIHVEGVRV